MDKSARPLRVVRFDDFEVDLRAGEIRRRGLKIKLQEQPFRVLAMLLDQPGEVVTRVELQKELWPAETFVDFDHGLNKAINKLRGALRDSAENSRFVETVGRRGYRFRGQIETPFQSPPPAPLAGENLHSIAVLPFRNINGDPEREYLSDGITESIINTLSQLPELRVIARSTVFRFKDKEVDLRSIGRELNVQAAVVGRLVQRGKNLVIGVELVDVHNGWQLWGENYNRVSSGIFAMEEEISKEICQKLHLRLTGKDKKQLAKRYTQDAEAYGDYLKGRFYCNQMTKEGIKKGVEFFKKATNKDPRYALAYAGMADAYCMFAFFDLLSPAEVMPKAKEAALRAVEIDDNLAEGHASLACIKESYDWDWPAAEKEFLRALELNPNYAVAHRWYADFLTAAGRTEEAAREIQKALKLDPLSVVINNELAWNYYMARQYDLAIEYSQKTIEMEPNFGPAFLILGMACQHTAKHNQAVTFIKKANELMGGPPSSLACLGFAYAMAGRRNEAVAMLDQLVEMSKGSHVSPHWLAIVYAGLGETDSAFECLERCHSLHDVWLIFLKAEPCFDILRSDHRFSDLLRRVGLQSTDFSAELPSPSTEGPQRHGFPGPIAPSSPPLGGRLLPEKIRLAVLPFQNLSADPEQEYFSDGLTEEMISQIGCLNPQRLGVIARTSVMQYKGVKKGIDCIGRELQVDYVLEGSVRRAENRVRITAQLIQVKDQTHLWAESYERELADILVIQNEVASRVGRSMAFELLPEVKALAGTARIPTAHEAYLRGRFFWNLRSEAGMTTALQCFEQAIEQDPNYALAYSGMSDCFAVLGWLGLLQPKEAAAKAKAAALRALKIEESLGEAHYSLAKSLHYDWNWGGAEKEFKMGIELNPNYATGRQWYAQYLSVTGNHLAAVAEAKVAQDLDPFSLIINAILGVCLFNAGQYERAIEQYQQALAMDAKFWVAHLYLGEAYLQKRMYADALTELQKSRELSGGNPEGLPFIGRVYAESGKRQLVHKVLRELNELSQKRYISPTGNALIYAGLGDKVQAFAQLAKAFKERDRKLDLLRVSPFLDCLRSDPRFEDLLRRVGLPMQCKNQPRIHHSQPTKTSGKSE